MHSRVYFSEKSSRADCCIRTNWTVILFTIAYWLINDCYSSEFLNLVHVMFGDIIGLSQLVHEMDEAVGQRVLLLFIVYNYFFRYL